MAGQTSYRLKRFSYDSLTSHIAVAFLAVVICIGFGSLLAWGLYAR